jgi:hypothetical protein
MAQSGHRVECLNVGVTCRESNTPLIADALAHAEELRAAARAAHCRETNP